MFNMRIEVAYLQLILQHQSLWCPQSVVHCLVPGFKKIEGIPEFILTNQKIYRRQVSMICD